MIVHSDYVTGNPMAAINPATIRPIAAACDEDRRRYFVISEDSAQPGLYFFHEGEDGCLRRLGITLLEVSNVSCNLKKAYRKYKNFMITRGLPSHTGTNPNIDIETEGNVPLVWLDVQTLGLNYLVTGELFLVTDDRALVQTG